MCHCAQPILLLSGLISVPLYGCNLFNLLLGFWIVPQVFPNDDNNANDLSHVYICILLYFYGL